MEFGSDDEKALTKAIEHVFPKLNRYLCTNIWRIISSIIVKIRLACRKRTETGSWNNFFERNGLVDAETTIDFEMKSKELDDHSREMYPVFATYFDNHLKTRLHNFVFIPNRKRQSDKLWTNNAESLNNILKLATNWRPKSTQELIEKIYEVTALHFMDYRSALHDTAITVLLQTRAIMWSMMLFGDARMKRKSKPSFRPSCLTAKGKSNKNTYM